MITLEERFAKNLFAVTRQAERSVTWVNSSAEVPDFGPFWEYYRGARLILLQEVVAELEELTRQAGWDEDQISQAPWEGWGRYFWYQRWRGLFLSTYSLAARRCPVNKVELHYVTSLLKTTAERIEAEHFEGTNLIALRMDLGSALCIIESRCFRSHWRRLSHGKSLNAVEHFMSAPHPQPAHLKSYSLAELGIDAS